MGETNQLDQNTGSEDELFAYDLKIDSQVEKFLELKHKLTFFLITAAVGSTGYTLSFSTGKLGEISGHRGRMICLVVACVLGLLAAAAALRSLDREIVSYRLHLKNRSQRKTWDQLSEKERTLWDHVNRRAKFFQNASFTLLTVSISFQAAFFLLFLIN